MSVSYKAPTITETLKTKPNYEDYVPGYFWSLLGSRPVQINKVCSNGNAPLQVRKGQSTEDVLLIAFTLGIYWPHTLQVWCP